MSLIDESIKWPSCAGLNRQLTSYEKLTIASGNISLRSGEMSGVLRGNVVPRIYPSGVGRHVLRAARNHFIGNLPSAQPGMSGRVGGVPHSGPCEFSPQLIRRVFGEDRLAAVLSGIAPDARTKYLGSWRHCDSCNSSRGIAPWIIRTSPDWGDLLIDLILLKPGPWAIPSVNFANGGLWNSVLAPPFRFSGFYNLCVCVWGGDIFKF